MKNRKKPTGANDNSDPDDELPDRLRKILLEAQAEMARNVVDHKQPPWRAFPDIKRESMGWRMGPGEDFWVAFVSWLRELDPKSRQEFFSENPEPEEWTGIYEEICRRNQFDGKSE